MSMHRTYRSAVAVFFFSVMTLLASPAAFSQSDAVAKVAGILSEMQHFPSDAQKESLAAISNDSSHSDAIRTIATAVRNIQHKAQPDDVSALKEVRDSASASEAEKQLASIVLDFHHQPSDQAKEKLKNLAM
ncbi:hypothetical protein QPM17_16050 [Marinobacter sp. TBZ242]|uniref:DUF4168 domain-containing protein n=1 Tax=Marinobacter azerbaijanicus TaxID=3050455 RepID=A0ABT7IER9_9GAMM|nr:hypothetical protein [Marinobacter sp. TBZ242]MDL0432654.1 hypothetical protein [Marinobacter sp. TBZ242]